MAGTCGESKSPSQHDQQKNGDVHASTSVLASFMASYLCE